MIMTNWASTSYCIEGSKEDLRRLYKLFDFMTGSKLFLVGSSDSLGANILKELGTTEEQLSKNNIHGFIDTYEFDENVLRIETKEVCHVSDFRYLLAQLMPKLKIYYILEKWENHVYNSNDTDGKYFPERYLVHACINGTTFHEYFRTEDEMKIFVSKLMGRKSVTIDEIGEWIEEHRNKDNFINIIEMEYVLL